MACVVDTGMPKNVADSMSSIPDNKAHAIPAVTKHVDDATKQRALTGHASLLY